MSVTATPASRGRPVARRQIALRALEDPYAVSALILDFGDAVVWIGVGTEQKGSSRPVTTGLKTGTEKRAHVHTCVAVCYVCHLL